MVCVLLDDSTVKCWGRVVYGGELVGYGIGTFAYQMGDALQPIAFGIGKTVIKVFTGPESACVILNDATSKCWGGNISGILGNGNSNILGDALDEMGDSLPTLDFGSTTAVSFSNNGFESTTSTRCAILATHSIRCWGNNDVGQLGIGDSVNHETIPNRLSDVQLGTGRTATSVAVGYNHVCALLDNATIKCWGYNVSGELGYGDYLNRGDGPEEMGDALPAMSLGTELLPTATRTYTKSRTPTRTMTRTRTRTATKTNTPTKTRTYTKSRTPTRSRTFTRTPTPSKSPTSTPTSTPTGTLTPTPTTIPTATDTAVPTATPWFQT
jgi:alpha-tubulin suppressor-like RCC1 family protein